MKIIFTDIDGVLKPFEAHKLGMYDFYPPCVDNYNKIFEAIPDLKIVVSSAWRNEKYIVEERLPSMIEIFKRNGIIGEVIDITDTYPTPKEGAWDMTKERAFEVSLWLGDQFWMEDKIIEQFIILDDDDLGFSSIFEPEQYLIVEDRYKGLTELHAQTIIESFNGKS